MRAVINKEEKMNQQELEQRVAELEKEVGYLKSVFDELAVCKEKLRKMEEEVDFLKEIVKQLQARS
jgi:uncharacterized coiled-coil protein SlyX